MQPFLTGRWRCGLVTKDPKPSGKDRQGDTSEAAIGADLRKKNPCYNREFLTNSIQISLTQKNVFKEKRRGLDLIDSTHRTVNRANYCNQSK